MWRVEGIVYIDWVGVAWLHPAVAVAQSAVCLEVVPGRLLQRFSELARELLGACIHEAAKCFTLTSGMPMRVCALTLRWDTHVRCAIRSFKWGNVGLPGSCLGVLA